MTHSPSSSSSTKVSLISLAISCALMLRMLAHEDRMDRMDSRLEDRIRCHDQEYVVRKKRSGAVLAEDSDHNDGDEEQEVEFVHPGYKGQLADGGKGHEWITTYARVPVS